MPSAKQILQSLLPPIIWRAGQALKKRLVQAADHFEHVPHAWASLSGHSEGYWAAFLDQERSAFDALVERVRAGEPVLAVDGAEDVKYLAYGYVLGVTAHSRDRVRV